MAYISAHVSMHLGSDTAALKTFSMTGGLQEAMKLVRSDQSCYRHVLRHQTNSNRMNAEGLPAKIDLNHIGVAGHSYGAWTTLVVGGEVIIKDGQRVNVQTLATIVSSRINGTHSG